MVVLGNRTLINGGEKKANPWGLVTWSDEKEREIRGGGGGGGCWGGGFGEGGGGGVGEWGCP